MMIEVLLDDGGGAPMSDIRSWLAACGFERFADVFEENEVDLEALGELTDDDLNEMGLPLGPRVKLRKAIQGLASQRESHSVPPFPAAASQLGVDDSSLVSAPTA